MGIKIAESIKKQRKLNLKGLRRLEYSAAAGGSVDDKYNELTSL